jgi:hypothetical protein
VTGIRPEDRAAIADLNARFAWALDRHDYDALRGILAPDVHYAGAGGEFTDAEAVIGSFRSRTGARTTRHGLGNLVLEPRGERRAAGLSSWHTFASNDDPPVGVGLYMVADFHDLYVQREDGEWRVAERIIRPVFRDPALAPSGPHADRKERRQP